MTLFWPDWWVCDWRSACGVWSGTFCCSVGSCERLARRAAAEQLLDMELGSRNGRIHYVVRRPTWRERLAAL